MSAPVVVVDTVPLISAFGTIWWDITAATIGGLAFCYWVAGLQFCRVLQKGALSYLVVPCLTAVFGVLVGAVSGCITALMIGAIYSSIPYSLPEDSTQLRVDFSVLVPSGFHLLVGFCG